LQQSAGSADDGEGLRALENKLKTIRNILLANLVILVVLLGCIFWQSSELAQTRDEVQQLHAQAQNAAGQLMPQLNDRLGVFEQRMDGMDAKIAAAQDRMVNRMNTAIPAMLDKYIAGKLAEVRR
jgi:type II secretory pathway component PulL